MTPVGVLIVKNRLSRGALWRIVTWDKHPLTTWAHSESLITLYFLVTQSSNLPPSKALAT